ncbi:MAG: ACT domain-containing protein, partial [Actinobacteria bacterium]
YTDVPGVFTADPRIVPEARKLHAVSYEEMLELAASGAKVLQLRSVEYARTHAVKVHVRSSFTDEAGTWITEEDVRMEQAIISGVAADDSEAKITIEDVPDQPGIVAAIFRAVADEGAGVDMIVQNAARGGRADVSFLVPKGDLSRIAAVVERVVKEVGGSGHTVDDGIALAREEINIEMISTSSIRISCVVRAADADRAVRAVHGRFDLGGDGGGAREHA